MDFLPISIKIKDKNILIVGGGKIAFQKLTTILKYTSNITVCAPDIIDEIINSSVRCYKKSYSKSFLKDNFLVYACTNDADVNLKIKKDCAIENILVNIADAPEYCDFVSPAIYKNKNISVAVSSDSKNVLEAIKKRDIIKSYLSIQKDKKIDGKVWLIGYGVGSPLNLTLRAHYILHNSDIIFYDHSVDKDFIKGLNKESKYVGKRKGSHSVAQNEINMMLLNAAQDGKSVVRLKGGDPLIFGRGGEEIYFLKKNKIEIEILPGISAFQSAASKFQISLTERGISSGIHLLSGHKNFRYGEHDKTLVYYMAGSKRGELSRSLIKSGVNADTPVFLISKMDTKDEKLLYTNVKEMGIHAVESPLLIIVGEVCKKDITGI